jgi:glycosidase
VLFYGEEIGMGENLSAKGRMAVRTPMQWSAGPGGGFTTAHPARLRVGMPDGAYGPEQVNVAAQRRDPDSLLAWITRLIRSYREAPELAWGECVLLDTPDDAVLAHRTRVDDTAVIGMHNFAAEPSDVEIHLDDLDDTVVLTDLLTDDVFEVSPEGAARISLGPYGCRWLRATLPGAAPEDAGPEISS